MRIVVDAFGGDNAPLEIIKGAAAASKEYGVDIYRQDFNFYPLVGFPFWEAYEDYNRQGVLICFETYGENKKMTSKTEYNDDGVKIGYSEYDANGQLVKFEVYNADGSVKK